MESLKNSFFTRLTTSLLALIVLCFCWFFFQFKGLLFLFMGAFLAEIWEFSLCLPNQKASLRWGFLLWASWLFLLFTFSNSLALGPSNTSSVFIFVALTFLAGATFFLFFDLEKKDKLYNLSMWCFGGFYCSGLSSVVVCGLLKFHLPYVFSLFILSFSTDTFAYLGGKLFGKTKLAPHISPQKTWEGVWMGLVGGTGLGFFYMSTLPHKSSVLLLAFCFLSSLMTLLGDLFASLIKREVGIKDWGSFLPGHGGILDRIDGLLFAAPIVYVSMTFILTGF